MDDELPRARRVELRLLDPLGVAELQAYVAELKAEVARAEQAIGKRRAQASVAENLFRK